jgi:hypothetical protein
MAIQISYPTATIVTLGDRLLGTQYDSETGAAITKNFAISSIVSLAEQSAASLYAPLAGATFTGNVIAPSFIKAGGTSVQFLMANGSTSTMPTLQQVAESGNTIVVPTTVAKGIDITLANESTTFQNGISVTIPAQTGIYPTYQPAPDAFVANINGQTPGTLIGSVVGFLANTAGEDNIGFFADLTATSGSSRGFETSSFDAHTGDYFIARKYTLGVDSTVFKVANNGDTTAKSFIKTGGTSAQFLKADGSTSTMPTLQQVTTAGAFTTNPIAITSLGDDALTINAGANIGVYSTTNEGTALYGVDSADGDGVYGESVYGNGVYGWSASGYGGFFYSDNTYSLVANGTAAKPGGGTWDSFSDSRVKENIKPYSKGLAEIILVNPINYEYNGLANTTKGIEYTGVIAQEIKDIFPETVTIYKAKLNKEDEEDTELYNFNSTALTFALINAVKELKAEIELLKSK